MKVLVTGSNGLLGQKLSELILSRPEHQLLATGKGPDRFGLAAGQYAEMDVSDENDAHAVVNSFRPDVIIHAAAITQVDQCELDHDSCDRINISGTQNIVKAANACGAFLIFISTDFIFDGTSGPYDESAKANPVNYYGLSKQKAEAIVMSEAKAWAIVRTVLVYGLVKDMSRSNIILWVKENLEKGKEIKVVTDQVRSPTLAEDLALGCLLVAEKMAGGIWNISGGEMLTPYEMAVETAAFFGLDSSLIHKADASSFSQPAKRPPRTGFIITKAKEILGYQPHSFREGLELLKKQMNFR
jgi:dTDP-4-dehydrorhamnose reductase